LSQHSSDSHPDLYRFLPGDRAARKRFRRVWLLNGVAGAAFGAAAVAYAVSLIPRMDNPQARIVAFALFLLVAFFARNTPAVCAAWVMSSDLEIAPDGVCLHLRDGHPRLVPWSAIRHDRIAEVRPAPLFHPNRPDDTAWVVVAQGLPLLYRVGGLRFGAAFRPVFVVTSDHERYADLVERIREGASA
jgi:hypothetical protein